MRQAAGIMVEAVEGIGGGSGTYALAACAAVNEKQHYTTISRMQLHGRDGQRIC